MSKAANIGLIGLAVMGANLARNLADKNISTLVFNRSVEKTEKFMEDFGDNPNLDSAATLEELVAGLERPRKLILMIKAGAPVDYMLQSLVPLLDEGDIVIDGGNSYFEDTERRAEELAVKGIEFVGMGVSGGEEGALNGPSLMPGGSEKAYLQLENILKAIAAKKDGEACVTHIGTGGAGHYVKMVHNGIEYADMQLIADVYSVMRHVLGMSPEEMAPVWAKWNEGELSSYLVEITNIILKRKDDITGKAMVDVIMDLAQQKGTGKWTALSALELGVPAPTITEAVFARCLSCCKEERIELEAMSCNRKASDFSAEEKAAILDDLRKTLYAAKICAYAQGFNILTRAAEEYGWKLDLGEIAKIWRNGCIIRADFLDRVTEEFHSGLKNDNLLFGKYFASVMQEGREGWGRVVALASEYGVPIPGISSALAYYDGYHTAFGSACMIQAQRDFFGAHGYRRVDENSGEDHHTEWI